MANISSGILSDANLMNLKEISLSDIRPEAVGFLVGGERILQAFATIRDQVLFTDKRVFVVNVQGITGKKFLIFPIPIPRCSISESKPPVCWISTAS